MMSRLGQFYICIPILASKNKFHVVCCLQPKALAFLINSKLSQFILNKPDLLACNAKIRHSEHSFLSYDSYVACCEPVSLANINPEHYQNVGQISEACKQEIILATDNSPLIVRRQKEWILAALRQ